MRRSPAERRHRVLIAVLVLLVIVQPIWSRMVDDLWNALVAPQPVQVVALPPIADAVTRIESAEPVEVAPAELSPEPATERTAPAADRALQPSREPTFMVTPESDTTAPEPPPVPEVLGASPRGNEVRVLVELRGNTVDAVLDEICLQAQAFIETDVSGATVRVLGQTDDEPAADLGLRRCP